MPQTIDPHILSDAFFAQIYQYASTEPIKTAIEIGSSDGTGTTFALITGLQANSEAYDHVFLLEPVPSKAEQLKQKYPDPRIQVMAQMSVYPVPMASQDEIYRFYSTQKSVLNLYPLELLYDWLDSEIELTNAIKNPISAVAHIKSTHHIESFDLAILDGGEFTSGADLDAVLGSRLIVLDDINSYKNHAHYHRLKDNPDYMLVYENWRHKHGVALFKKKPAYKPGISVVVHTRNEEENIKDCLDSVRWADEIILVDMGSTDRTLNIASDYNAKVYQHIQTTCVEEARNFAVSQVNYRWTLVLDADERIPEALYIQCKLFAEKAPAVGMWVPRQNFFFGHAVPHLFPDYQPRFFQSGMAYWSGRIHQHPQIPGKLVFVNPTPELAIQHYSYSSPKDFAQRQIRYSDIESRDLVKNPVHVDPLQLRQLYQDKLEAVLHHVKSRHLDTFEWVIKMLYSQADLLTTAFVLDNAGLVKPEHSGNVSLSAYLYFKNAIKFDYPYQAALATALYIADEVVITYATDSEDDTEAMLKSWAERSDKIKLYPTDVWKNNPHQSGEVIRLAAEEAMSLCTHEWLFHIQADECYHSEDLVKIKEYLRHYSDSEIKAFTFQVVHFYGNYDTVISQDGDRIGWYQHCIRLSRKGETKHFKDAWTQIVPRSQKGDVVDLPITLYHYGHVREKEAMRLKMSYMETLYKDLPEDYAYCEPGEYNYDKVPPQFLTPFEGEHPIFIEKRVYAPPTHVQPKPILLILTRFHGLEKGFSITIRNIYKTNILQEQFEVHHLAWHFHGADYQEMGVHIHGVHEEDHYGVTRFKDLLYTLDPDLVLLHADAHFFIEHIPMLKAWTGPKIGWFTIDYFRDTPPDTLAQVHKTCHLMLSPSHHGVKILKQSSQYPVKYLPLAVDHSIYKTVQNDTKQRLRHELGIPEDAFVFIMVGNNFWRKGVEYSVESFLEMLKRYPTTREKCLLYLHTEKTDILTEYIHSCGLENKVIFTPDYDPIKSPIKAQDLAGLYQMADALVLTTLGEGFGLPLLEAQACGLPVIAPEHSSVKDVVKDAGLYITPAGKIVGNTAKRLVWMSLPDIPHTAQHMYTVYSTPELRDSLRQNALRNASHFRWDRTVLKLNHYCLSQLDSQPKGFQFPEPELIPI